MQPKRALALAGLVLMIVGLGWWAVFYGGAADRIGAPLLDFLRETAVCSVYTTDYCAGVRIVADLFGFGVYHPLVLWAGIVCLSLAAVLLGVGKAAAAETVATLPVALLVSGRSVTKRLGPSVNRATRSLNNPSRSWPRATTD